MPGLYFEQFSVGQTFDHESFPIGYLAEAAPDVREIGQPRMLVSAAPLKTLTLKQLADAIVRTVAGARR